jgi:DNA-binding response OmpR family regulator
MRTILTISQDELLLETRAAVLRQTKAEVVAATASEAKKILKSRQFDLVVLCHSLSVEETLEIASLAHQQTIAVPVLTVVPNADPVSEWRFIAPDSTASCDPGLLVEKVAGLLSVSPSGTN